MPGDPQIRRSQAIRTFGPGALIDLPREAAIVGGLDTWPPLSKLEEVVEPRLSQRVGYMVGKPAPKLYLPPADDSAPWERGPSVTAWRFPKWFVVNERVGGGAGRERVTSRRLVHAQNLDDKRKFDGRHVIPTRFVQACPRGHISDISWMRFVHQEEGGASECYGRQLWLDEKGTGGDLGDISVRCECGKTRPMSDAADMESKPLGTCFGSRPWLGGGSKEDCKNPSRLLIRTATNAYFAQTVTVLSLPSVDDPLRLAAEALLRHVPDVSKVSSVERVASYREFGTPALTEILLPFSDKEVFEEFQKLVTASNIERPDRFAELDAILSAEIGYDEDVPLDGDFHARRLSPTVWSKNGSFPAIDSVIQLHRLREVTAMVGFTRFEAPTQDQNGEVDSDVELAEIQEEPYWYPAVENRGEGLFIQLDRKEVAAWAARGTVKAREGQLLAGFERWRSQQKSPGKHEFVGLQYILLHTLSHLLMDSLSMTCGYPASSIKERIYCDTEGGRYGLLLYTGTPDADGTLGGLVAEGRNIEAHLNAALRRATLCSNDPICAGHTGGKSMEGRWLHGAACHGCAFVAETSCEMRNDHLDRALVVPTLGHEGAAFFGTNP